MRSVLTRTLGTMLYEVSPTDPAVLAGTVGGVVLVALAASVPPGAARDARGPGYRTEGGVAQAFRPAGASGCSAALQGCHGVRP